MIMVTNSYKLFQNKTKFKGSTMQATHSVSDSLPTSRWLPGANKPLCWIPGMVAMLVACILDNTFFFFLTNLFCSLNHMQKDPE